MSEKPEIDKIIAVSDTGPLISAFQCHRTDLLKRYFLMIYITTSELTEFDKHDWTDDIRKLIKEGFVRVASVLTDQEKAQAEEVAKRIAACSGAQGLDWRDHLPEAEAIIIIQQRTHLMIEQILLDEKAARKVAQDMGLNVMGFPGVLRRAGQDGLLAPNEIRQLLKVCQQQGTHYSNTLIEILAQTARR